MVIGNKEEEEKKDEVLQQINDLLERCGWGGACKRLIIRVEFEGKFNLKPFHVQTKEVLNEQ
jgi:hypothetical protein